MKNRLRLSSLVAVVAVAEAVAAVVAVHQVQSATSVPVSLVLEGLQLRVPDSVAPSSTVVTVLLCPVSSASESDALHLIPCVGSNLLDDFCLIIVR